MPVDMTHRMRASFLTAPDHLFGVDQLRADLELIPAEPGIYGWWFNQPPPGVHIDGATSRNGWSWLYVGLAKSRPASRSNLRRRLRFHLFGPIGSSTLRRTLAALLPDELNLRYGRSPSGRDILMADGEAKLSDWMAEHMRVTWVLDPEPWTLEGELISAGPVLPLNIKGSTGAFAALLSAKRSAIREQAISKDGAA